MSSQPNQPEEIQPNQPEETPNEIQPNQPNQPEETQPNQPEEIQPNQPEEIQPNQPEETQPNQPEESPNQPAISSFEMTQPDQMSEGELDQLVSSFQYNPERDTASDVRNALLVVMALIAAATFQAALNPPVGVCQDTKNNDGSVNQKAGCLNPGFLFFNTLAFGSSCYVISYLVYRFPFYILIWIGLFSFSFAYDSSIPSNPCGPAYLNELLAVVASLLPVVTSVAWYALKAAWRRGRIARLDQSV